MPQVAAGAPGIVGPGLWGGAPGWSVEVTRGGLAAMLERPDALEIVERLFDRAMELERKVGHSAWKCIRKEELKVHWKEHT